MAGVWCNGNMSASLFQQSRWFDSSRVQFLTVPKMPLFFFLLIKYLLLLVSISNNENKVLRI